MIYGFTGTRRGTTEVQRKSIRHALRFDDHGFANGFLHGGALGADEEADKISAELYCEIEVYPCTSERYLYWVEKGDGIVRAIHAVRPPLVRNRIIVDRADHTIATPFEKEEPQFGGTWYTIRYARKQRRPLTIILPDGTTQVESTK